MTCKLSDKCDNVFACNILRPNVELLGCSFYKPKKPITNEEYLRSCTTEQLAEFIADVCYGLLDDVWSNDGDTSCDYRETEKNYWVEWLKQPHKGE